MTLAAASARACGGGLAALVLLITSAVARDRRPDGELRVCADPNNLPYSNMRREGFENKIAEHLAEDLGWELKYTWWAQRRGHVRNTLNGGACDVILGTPALDMLQVTRPYYRSGYVFVSRAGDNIELHTFKEPELRTLRVGVQLIGDDGFNTPPAHALGRLNITGNVTGFPVYGDYRDDSPSSTIMRAVSDGTIDVATVWGPLAGYYAKSATIPLRLAPIKGTESFHPLTFEFAIGMGVRKSDDALKRRLDDFIARRQAEIDHILDTYNIPRF